MGINQLNKIIKKYSPNAIIERNIQYYKHKKIALDSSILLYKYRYADNSSNDSHIYGFVQRVCYYLKHGILPIFVFDGIPPIEKKQILDKRVKQKNKVELKIQTLIEHKSILIENNLPSIEIEQYCTDTTILSLDKINSEIDKLKKQVTYVTKTHRQECKYLLKLLGIPVIEADGEAENTCACLQKAGIVDYTFTEDTDALTFGSSKMLKSARKLEKVVEIDLCKVLDGLDFNMDEFIDFCILCGCDYCPTIPKIGPITALKLIQEYSSIENIVDNIEDKYNIPDNFDYKTARKLFHYDPVQQNIYDIDIKDIQTDKLREFIIDEKELSDQIYDNIIKKYTKSLNEYYKHNNNKISNNIDTCKQSSILDFFNSKNI